MVYGWDILRYTRGNRGLLGDTDYGILGYNTVYHGILTVYHGILTVNNGILVVYWWCGILVVYWWYTGGKLVANWWYTGTLPNPI